MTIDKAKLKALAQAVADLEDIPEREDEHAEAVDALWLNMHCHTILELLAEIERLEAQARLAGVSAEMTVHQEVGRATTKALAAIAERDQLRAENEQLRKDAERWKWLEGSADAANWESIGCQAEMNRHLHVDAAMTKEAPHG
ncbi:hypothetical protein AB9U01_09340 [Pseudomonas qingdaonensis]|uniref:hypothetical protein n=1 Tax=Pseudomonas qingdaonensis TaxID=2056231 RepID=UPI00351500D2